MDDYTKQNIMVIQGKFAKLLQNVRANLQKKLKEDQIKGDLRLFILELFPNISPDLIPISSDLTEIFEAVRRHGLWSYINYFSLEQIVMQFAGEDSDITSEMEQFKKARAGFQLATKIKDYIPAAKACLRKSESPKDLHPLNSKDFTKLSCKLDERVAEYSLRYLEELWQLLSFHMQLPPITLLFDIIDSGCIQVVFLIPTKRVPQAIRQAKYSAHFYTTHQICCVMIGGKCVYEFKHTSEKGSIHTIGMVRKQLRLILVQLSEVERIVKVRTRYTHVHSMYMQLCRNTHCTQSAYRNSTPFKCVQFAAPAFVQIMLLKFMHGTAKLVFERC